MNEEGFSLYAIRDVSALIVRKYSLTLSLTLFALDSPIINRA
jgi:hypothetical protein